MPGPFRTLPVAKCRVFGRRCRVDVWFFRETRHQFSKQNQSLRGKISGMAGFSRMREVLRKRAAFFFVHGRGAPGVHFWTPVGLQTASPKRVGVCKSLRNLVGPPRFELGTSCTPSKRASQAAPRPESSIVRQTGAAGAARIVQYKMILKGGSVSNTR